MYKILVVDDEMIFRKGIRTMLQKSDLPIERLAEAQNGEEAMEILVQEKYDIVITDIRMPKMDGLMLCKTMREQKMDPITIILSGYDDFKYAQKAIQYGVSDYVLKPISQSKLMEVLTKALEEREKRKTGLSYDEMDRIVSGLAEALWEQREEEYLKLGREAEQKLDDYGKRQKQEILHEIIANTLVKVSRQLEEELTADHMEPENYRENLKILWQTVYGRKHMGMLDTARKYLLENPAMTQEEICARMGISPTHFSAIFKEKTGKKFVDFRMEVRMEIARKLLCIPSRTITQVAYEAGYSDYAHFSRLFKKYYGVTPAQFREERGLSL